MMDGGDEDYFATTFVCGIFLAVKVHAYAAID